ncbi:MAG: murein DD-endopeptidase MepM/ murein hydrolase activator NlpD [Cyclobacteriaceae bacterium]|jgi:murein DD-endopeptidase MepM/ murein hydrolase activator NlpD
MNDWLIYLIKASVIQGIIWGVYVLFFRKANSFRANRVLLLLGMTSSVILPGLQFSWSTAQHWVADMREAPVLSSMGELITMTRVAQVSETASPLRLLTWVYVGIGILLFARACWQLFQLNKTNDKKLLIQKPFKVYSTQGGQAYSFFGHIHIPASTWQSPNHEHVLIHEQQHARLGHSWDRLFMEVMLVLLWFNPFIYFIKRSLIEVHEFEADQAVLQRSVDKYAYQLTLLDETRKILTQPLVSYFSLSNTKRRLHMINNNKQTSNWRYILMVPVVISLLGIFSFNWKTLPKVYDIELPAVALINGMGEKLQGMLQEVSDEVPSISPVKIEGDEIKITSGFGKRPDPWNNNEPNYHKGLDIRATLRTPVITPANGTIVKIENQPKGYGKWITVKHNDQYETRFAHLDGYAVEMGQTVTRGDTIAYVGNTGKSRGPHLHYEVWKDGKRVDPARYIKDYQAN